MEDLRAYLLIQENDFQGADKPRWEPVYLRMAIKSMFWKACFYAKMTKNLTEGNPRKVIISYTIPLFISVVFQQIYSIADSVIAGRYAGEDALAAVGASYPVTMIFMAVAMGFQRGCMVVISKNFGSSNMQRTKTCISTSLISGFVLSVILTISGLLSSKSLMKLLDTPDNIFADSVLYLKIYLGGFVFLFLYNVANGVFNSIGDSKTPLYLLIVSSIGNIILDAVFVINFHLGVAGVAWVTAKPCNHLSAPDK